ncbi:MAG: NAD(P)/FAD-dependent oxidoreductase [Actinobacteria bacterium]|nr:NAD(P)/FAD-dependent oxidoreductase [Actinomycetota bacterium]
MQAAITAAERGHEVVLFEKAAQLGGNLYFASRPDFKDEMKRFHEYLLRRVSSLGVEVRVGVEANHALVEQEKADAVIVAVGAEPARPDIPGLLEAKAVWAGDVFADLADVGARVVIAGGGGIGCECALHLAKGGKKVVIAEMLDEAALDFNFINRGMLLDLLRDAGVDIRTGAKVVAFSSTGITVEDAALGRTDIAADTVVLALGMTPRSDTVESLAGTAPIVVAVGDCVKPRLVIDAVREGFHAAAEL